MRKTIPKPESQTDGCGQALGSLEGSINTRPNERGQCFAEHECSGGN